MTLQKMRQRPAPSTIAASSSSLGSDRTNWRIRNTANGFASMPGTMSARCESTQPRRDISR